jgi:hypothetical protein
MRSLRHSSRAPLAALLSIALLCLPAPFPALKARAAGSTFHVAASGDDNNDGSRAICLRD